MKKPSSWDWIRHTSLGMCVIFIYVNVVYGAIEPAKGFWEERKAAVEGLRNGHSPRVSLPDGNSTLLAQLPALELNLLPTAVQNPGLPFPSTLTPAPSRPAFLAGKPLPRWLEALPASYVSIKDLYLPQGYKPGDLMVIHIQDAHGNVDAQKNIARAIESLSKPDPKLPASQILVGIEGAKGAFNFAPYRSFPDTEITRQIADYFLKEGFITGPEHVGMTFPELPLFWGIEDESLYLSHVKALKDSVALEKEANAQIEKISGKLEKIKDKELNPALRDLDRKITLHHKGKLGLGEYLKFLASQVKTQPPAVKQFLSALSLEESLDYKKVELERGSLTRKLAGELPKSELQNLVKAGLAYRLGNLNHGTFYQYLKDLCSAYGIKLSSWPEMDKYIRYVLLSEKIKAEDLLAEVAAMERKTIAAAIKNDRELELVEQSRDVALTEKLVKHELSPQEWNEYNRRLSRERGNPSDVLRPFEAFNQAALARNAVLVGNLLNKAKETDHAIAVMVTGGFHTEGISEILKAKKTAYAVLTPRLGKVEGSGSEYLDVFTRDKTPLEKLFSGERITLASPSHMAPTVGLVTFEEIPVVEGQYVGLMALFSALKALKSVGFDAWIATVDAVFKKIRSIAKSAGFLTLRDSELTVNLSKDPSAEPIKSMRQRPEFTVDGKDISSAVSYTIAGDGATVKGVTPIATADVGRFKIEIAHGSLGVAGRARQIVLTLSAIARGTFSRISRFSSHTWDFASSRIPARLPAVPIEFSFSFAFNSVGLHSVWGQWLYNLLKRFMPDGIAAGIASLAEGFLEETLFRGVFVLALTSVSGPLGVGILLISQAGIFGISHFWAEKKAAGGNLTFKQFMMSSFWNHFGFGIVMGALTFLPLGAWHYKLLLPVILHATNNILVRNGITFKGLLRLQRIALSNTVEFIRSISKGIARSNLEIKLDIFHARERLIAPSYEDFDKFSVLYGEVKTILERLLKAEGLDSDKYDLYLIDSQEPNAFVMPKSGKFFVSLGLIRMLMEQNASQDALAWVLGHELVHVRQHLQDAAAGRQRSGEGIIQSHFTDRTMEYQSDLAILALLDEAGFSVKAAPAFFQALLKWQEARKLKELKWGGHPETEERLRKLNRYIMELYWKNFLKAPELMTETAKSQANQRTRYRLFQERVVQVSRWSELESILLDAQTPDELEFAMLVGSELLPDIERTTGLARLKAVFNERAIAFAQGDPSKELLYGFMRDEVLTMVERRSDRNRLTNMQASVPSSIDILLDVLELGIPKLFAARIDIDPKNKSKQHGAAEWILQLLSGSGISLNPGPRGNMPNDRFNMYGTGFLNSVIAELTQHLAEGRLTLEESRRFFQAIKLLELEAGAMGQEQRRISTNRFTMARVLLSKFAAQLTVEDTVEVLNLYESGGSGYMVDFTVESGAKELLAFALNAAPPARAAILEWLKDKLPDPVHEGGTGIDYRENHELRPKLIRDDAQNFLKGKPSFLFHGSPMDLDNLLSQEMLVRFYPEGIARFLRDIDGKVSNEELVAYHRKILKQTGGVFNIFYSLLWKTRADPNYFNNDVFEQALLDAVDPSLRGVVRNARRELKPLLYLYALGGSLDNPLMFIFGDHAKDNRGNMMMDEEIAKMIAEGSLLYEELEDTTELASILKKIHEAKIDDEMSNWLSQRYDMLSPERKTEIRNRWNEKNPPPVPEHNVHTGEFGLLSALLRSIGKPIDEVELQSFFNAIGHSVRLTEHDVRHISSDWDAFGEGISQKLENAKAAERSRPRRATRLNQEGIDPDRTLALFDFISRLPADYGEAVDMVQRSLLPSVFRNFVLYFLFVDRVLNDRLGLGLSKKDAFDEKKVQAALSRLSPQARREVLEAVKVLTRGPTPFLIHDSSMDAANQSVLTRYAGNKAFQKETANEAEIRSEHKSEVGEYDDAFYATLGGPSSQLNILAAKLAESALEEFLAQPGDLSEQRAAILDIYPAESPARDRWLQKLLEIHGYRGPPGEIVAILNLFADQALRDNLALRALDQVRVSDSRSFQKLDSALAIILQFFPNPSLIRDDILEETAQALVRTPEQYEHIKALLINFFRAPEREIEKSPTRAVFVNDLFRVIVKSLSSEQKAQLLLWLMGISERKPFFLVHAEHTFHVRFDQVRSLYSSNQSRFYPDAGVTAHREATEPFLYGETGLLTNPAASRDFLNQLFDAIIPAGASREVLRIVYDAAFEHADAERREEIFLNLTRSLSSQRGDVENLSPQLREARTIRVFLQSLGLMGVKVGQFLASSPMVPAHIRRELSQLKDRARKLPKGIIFDMVEKIFGTFKSTFDEIAVPLGSASIKVVYKAKLKSGRWVALKLKRPEVEKSVEEDIAFMSRILDAIRAPLAQRGIPIPKRLISQIEQVVREELNFDQEFSNMQRLRKNLLSSSALRRTGNWVFRRVASWAWPSPDKKYQFSVPEPIRVSMNAAILEEWVDGVSLADESRLSVPAEDLADMQRAAAREFLRQIFVDGFYHADPHTGNIMVERQGAMYLIDLGAASEISLHSRQILLEIFSSVGRRNGESLVSLIRSLGGTVTQDLRNDMRNHVAESQESLTSRLLWFFQVAEDHDVPLPDDLLRVFRFLGAGGALFEITEKGLRGPPDSNSGGSLDTQDKELPPEHPEKPKSIFRTAVDIPLLLSLVLFPTSIFSVLSAFVPLDVRLTYFLPVAALFALIYGARLSGMIQRGEQVASLAVIPMFYRPMMGLFAQITGASQAPIIPGAQPLGSFLSHFSSPRQWFLDARSILKAPPAVGIIILSFLAPTWQSLIFPNNLTYQLLLGGIFYLLSWIFQGKFDSISGGLSQRFSDRMQIMHSVVTRYGKVAAPALLRSIFGWLIHPTTFLGKAIASALEGLGEESLFRGGMMWGAVALVGHHPWLAAALSPVQALVFGLSHVYTEWQLALKSGQKITFWAFARQYLTSPPFIHHVVFGAFMGLISLGMFAWLGDFSAGFSLANDWSLLAQSLIAPILLHATNNIAVRMGYDLKGWLRVQSVSRSTVESIDASSGLLPPIKEGGLDERVVDEYYKLSGQKIDLDKDDLKKRKENVIRLSRAFGAEAQRIEKHVSKNTKTRVVSIDVSNGINASQIRVLESAWSQHQATDGKGRFYITLVSNNPDVNIDDIRSALRSTVKQRGDIEGMLNSIHPNVLVEESGSSDLMERVYQRSLSELELKESNAWVEYLGADRLIFLYRTKGGKLGQIIYSIIAGSLLLRTAPVEGIIEGVRLINIQA